MLPKQINFDQFVRGLVFLGIFGAIIWSIGQLSSVLLPFVVALMLAYMLYPIVSFLQYKCHLRWRGLCVTITLLLIPSIIIALTMLAYPSIHAEWLHLSDIALDYIEGRRQVTGIAASAEQFIIDNKQHFHFDALLHSDDFLSTLKEALPQVWNMLWSTAAMVINAITSLFALIYLFLLLVDYEKYSEGWVQLIPHKQRRFAQQLVEHIKIAFSRYFRGQALIALCNCIMFPIGFWLIGMPLPLLLGVTIGIISFIPYIQVVGFLPAFSLALLKSADTGESIWALMGGVIAVYVVIQIIQDVLITPRIMGRIIGLPGAIVFLSLTVWGYLLGMLGLIIALPATTILVSYYKKYVIGNCPETVPKAE